MYGDRFPGRNVKGLAEGAVSGQDRPRGFLLGAKNQVILRVGQFAENGRKRPPEVRAQAVARAERRRGDLLHLKLERAEAVGDLAGLETRGNQSVRAADGKCGQQYIP